MKTLLPSCFCGSTAYERFTKNGLPVLVCTDCHAMRQHVEMDLTGYAAWYERQYHAGQYQHTYEHDLFVAAVRLEDYQIPKGSRLLDIGAGNNAFVFDCRSRGIDAWGQDLARQADGTHTYVGALSEVAFPSESFDYVTMHDVLEHVPDPIGFLGEVRRILKPGGTLYVDFPRFHHEAGLHHWKLVEHIWLLDESKLARLLTSAGFVIARTWHPIDSKVAVASKKMPEKRISMLVPPGIGDSYWSITKVPGLLKQTGAERADVYVEDSHPRRTDPFLRNVATVTMQDYLPIDVAHPVRIEAYHKNARTIFPGEFGMDFFVSYNGALEGGRSLTEADPELGVDWRPRMHFSKEAMRAQSDMQAGGPYTVCYFIDHGMYKKWLADFPSASLDRVMTMLARQGLRPVVVGAPWDEPLIGNRLGNRPGRINMVGKTTFDQLFGIIAGASAVVGFPSGATMLGPILNVPTVLLWCRKRFANTRFWTNCVPPDAPYVALDTRRLKPEKVLSHVSQMMAKRAAA